jgi:hypothetical protein
MLNIYGRNYSVVYDLATITELMGAAEDEKRTVFLANLLYLSLAAIYQNKDGQSFAKEYQASFDEFWSLAQHYLSFKKINEIMQPHRNNDKVIEPLLKVLFLMTQSRPSESDGTSGGTQVMQDLI